MRFKVIFILCVAFCSLVALYHLSPLGKTVGPPKALARKDETHEKRIATPLVSPPQLSLPAQPAPQNQVQTFDRATLQGIISRGFGDGALEARNAMEASLKTWNPIGRSALELKAAFGKPSVEKVDSITYMFDTGYFGWVFVFVLKEGKVVELKRLGSD